GVAASLSRDAKNGFVRLLPFTPSLIFFLTAGCASPLDSINPYPRHPHRWHRLRARLRHPSRHHPLAHGLIPRPLACSRRRALLRLPRRIPYLLALDTAGVVAVVTKGFLG